MANHRTPASETLVLPHGHPRLWPLHRYQLYRFSFTQSVCLLLITLVDVIVIALTWHEYKYLRGLLRRLK